MQCREGCGACCIAPSITSSIPGMPNGKAAGERCVQLSDDYRCKIFGSPQRPTVCGKFKADPHICGETREQAMRLIGWLEDLTVQKN